MWQLPPNWLQAFGGPLGEEAAGSAEALAREQAKWQGRTKPWHGSRGSGKGSSKRSERDGEGGRKPRVEMVASDDESLPMPYNWNAPSAEQATGKRMRKGAVRFEADFRSDKQRIEQRQHEEDKQ